MPPLLELTKDLELAIRDLYDVFQKYEFTDRIGDAAFPGYCNVDELHSISLPTATSSQLVLFALKSTTTWGSSQDYRHFLPRICELIAVEGVLGEIDPQIVFGKLPGVSWREWPVPEVECLLKYFGCLWDRSLRSAPSFLGGGIGDPLNTWTEDAAHTWLEVIAVATEDVSPFLSTWQQLLLNDGSLMPHLNLAAVFLDSTINRKGQVPWCYIPHGSAIENEFLSWLRDIQSSVILERAFYRTDGTPYAAILSTAQQRAEWFLT